MSCSSCSMSVETVLGAMTGIVKAEVNFANSSVKVEYNPDLVSPELMKTKLQQIGFDMIIENKDDSTTKSIEEIKSDEYRKMKVKTLGAAIFTIPVMIFGMFFMNEPFSKWISLAFAIPVIFIFGRGFYIKAFNQIKHRTATMDTLVATSTGIAFLFSLFNTLYPEFWISQGLEPHVYYEAAAAIITFILLGKLLEEKAKVGTSTAIKKLIGLQPNSVTILNSDGTTKTISIKDVKVNDFILVKPGDKIAVDGEITEGNSYVDESMINGEPIPIEKSIGSEVYAGTINQKGSFVFVAKKVGEATFLSRIIKMVQEAQGSKAPIQKLVDKVASVFVPGVFAISVITFAVWMVFGGENAFSHAMITSVTVLVIACPCALGLATPTAMMVGIGKAAESNILIKNAESLEIAKKVNVVIFDKTGTLTEGKPTVSKLIENQDYINDKHYGILVAMEIKSEHPLAEAIVQYFENIKPEIAIIENFESITGKGVSAYCQGYNYFVGNKKLIIENGIVIDSVIELKVEELQSAANTVVYFADSRNVLAVISISDRIKGTSADAVAMLNAKGIETIMLTGDNSRTASAIAKKAGIISFRSEMLPFEKAQFIKELQDSGKIVAMVGDGINDSPALAQADISIAMGKGSDIAIDVAGITIISADLMAIPKILELSKQTVRTLKQNLFWAFIYNIIGIPIAAGVLFAFNGFLLNPAIAAAAMAFSSVSVVLNSLRLKHKRIINI